MGAPTDLDVESDHEHLRDGKTEKSDRNATSTKRSPSPSDDGEEPPREKAPRLSSPSNYADTLASLVPTLWSPAAREVTAAKMTMVTTSGCGGDFYRNKFRRTTAGRSTERGVEANPRSESDFPGPPGEEDGSESFFAEVDYGIESDERRIFAGQPEAWAATATRTGRGEVRVGRLDAETGTELMKVKDTEVQNWLKKNLAVEVASRSGLSRESRRSPQG